MLDGTATVGNVLDALTTVDVMHLAAHGRLATNNPLFSDLRLHDGPLVVYDLERLPRVPRTVVLAACDSGRSVVRTGDELLGLAATFIARGTVRLIASVVPIPDAETAPLMVALHERIAKGHSPAAALAEAQHAVRDLSPAGRAAAAGFVCIGA
jgi:CHAT domain-containing protein